VTGGDRLRTVARWVTGLIRTRYAPNGEGRIAYEVRGARHTGRPWLVLVQGLGFDRSGWEPVVRRLRPHFRLILVDNRGSGGSDLPTDSLTVRDMARDVVSVLDAVGVPATHVLGVSLGGMVAQDLAVDHADRVRRLVLACTTPGWPFAYPMPVASVRLMNATRLLPPEVALRRHVENALSADTVANRPDLVERIVEFERRRPSDPGAFAAQAAAGARYVGQLRQTQIRAHTLVLHGDADTVVDPRNAALLADRIPHASLVILPGLGHLFFWEDPDRFVREVTTFLLAAADTDGRPAAEAGPEPTGV
jgi:3-oxoadipate enol-lactonase